MRLTAAPALILFVLACGGGSKAAATGPSTGSTTTGSTSTYIPDGAIGSDCYHESECDSGVCIFHPVYQGYYGGFCTDTCVDQGDCPASNMYCCEWPPPIQGTATGTATGGGTQNPWMCQPVQWLQPDQLCDGITP